MLYVMTALLAIGAIIFISYPLYRYRFGFVPENEKKNGPDQRYAATQRLLEELEIDFRMGNIPEDEYRELDAKYRSDLN